MGKWLLLLILSVSLTAGAAVAQGPARGPDKAATEDATVEKDALHQLEVARQYFKLRKAYVAALSRTEEIIAGYPAFSKLDEAYYIAGLSSLYLADGKGKQKSPVAPEQLRTQAREYLSEIINRFPASTYRDEANDKLKKLGGPVKP